MTDGDFKLIREHRCGEGMAGQNSSTMFIGIGRNESVQSVAVDWLSGVKQTFSDVSAGTLLTVYENPEDSPNKTPEVRTPYVVASERTWQSSESEVVFDAQINGILQFPNTRAGTSTAVETPKLFLYTTMATWCAACKRHLPQLQQLRGKLAAESLAMYGIPIDEADDAEKLTGYVEQYRPAYELLKDLTTEQRIEVQQLVADALKTDALPSTVMTDADGRILLITGGLPTISQIRKLLIHHSTTP